MCGSLDSLKKLREDLEQEKRDGAIAPFPSWLYCWDLDVLGETVNRLLSLPIDEVNHNDVASIYDAVMAARHNVLMALEGSSRDSQCDRLSTRSPSVTAF